MKCKTSRFFWLLRFSWSFQSSKPGLWNCIRECWVALRRFQSEINFSIALVQLTDSWHQMMCAITEINLRCVIAARLSRREAVEIIHRWPIVFPRESAASLTDGNGRNSFVVDNLHHFDNDFLCRAPQNRIAKISFPVSERNIIRMVNENLNVFGNHHLQFAWTVLTIAEKFFPVLGLG